MIRCIEYLSHCLALNKGPLKMTYYSTLQLCLFLLNYIINCSKAGLVTKSFMSSTMSSIIEYTARAHLVLIALILFPLYFNIIQGKNSSFIIIC